MLRLLAPCTATLVALGAFPAHAQSWGASAAWSVVALGVDYTGADDQRPMAYPIVTERAAFSAGITYRARSMSRLRIQPELWLFDRGGDGVHVRYLELPVFVQLLPLSPRDHRVVPVFTFGGGPAARLQCSLTHSGSAAERRECGDTAGTHSDLRTRRMDFGVGGGLGVESRAPGGARLGVELRLWTGLWDVGYLQHFRRRNASASLIASVGRT